MPNMPSGCQLGNLNSFLEVEQGIRSGRIDSAKKIDLPEYWRDLSLVILRFADYRFKRGAKVADENFSSISNIFYRNFFVKKPIIVKNSTSVTQVQDSLDLGLEDAT
jgi:hypothetical protein